MNYFEQLLQDNNALSERLTAALPKHTEAAREEPPASAQAESVQTQTETFLETVLVPQTQTVQADAAQLSRTFERDARRYG